MIAPLRKIVKRIKVDIPVRKEYADTYGTPWRIYEVLECGHKQPIKQDIYGDTNAYRRRCKQCLKNSLI